MEASTESNTQEQEDVKSLNDVDRRSMRFPVADELRAVELLVSRDRKFDAEIIDISAGGICISVAEDPELEKEQDVFVINRYSVESCVVRWAEPAEEEGTFNVGLQRCHVFPLSQLPKKQKKLRAFKSSYSWNSVGTYVFIVLILFFGFSALIFGLNLCNSRERLVNWLAMPSRYSEGSSSSGASRFGSVDWSNGSKQSGTENSRSSSGQRSTYSPARENSVRIKRKKQHQFSPDDVMERFSF